MDVFFVFNFAQAALIAHEEPLGVGGLIDEQAFGARLRIVLVKPAFDDSGVFGGIFVSQDDLLGTAAMCEPVHGGDRFPGFGARSSGMAGFWIFGLRLHELAAAFWPTRSLSQERISPGGLFCG
jgi:hypothetical protein